MSLAHSALCCSSVSFAACFSFTELPSLIMGTTKPLPVAARGLALPVPLPVLSDIVRHEWRESPGTDARLSLNVLQDVGVAGAFCFPSLSLRL